MVFLAKNKRILFLYTQLMGYQISTIKTLTNHYSATIKVVSWDDNRNIPYKIPTINNVIFYKKSEFNYSKLKEIVDNFKPDIIITSGWIVNDYNKICNYSNKKGIITVAASDSQWKGTLRQRIGVLISNYYHRKFFNYLWVAGPRQYEYARLLGYSNNEIIFNCYSADLEIFNREYQNNFENKIRKYPRTLLFVGRFSTEKGIELLLDVIDELHSIGFGWNLILVGGGPLSNKIIKKSFIEVVDYLQPNDLPTIIRKSGVFLLPSISEPWGVVIHEFAAAGLPIICSDSCGALTEFVINGYNGLIFNQNSKNSLKQSLEQLNNISDVELINMGMNSHKLAQRITPETAAANLMSIF